MTFIASDGISTDARFLVSARQYLIEKYRYRLEQHKHHLIAQNLHVQHALDLVQIAALGAQVSDKTGRA